MPTQTGVCPRVTDMFAKTQQELKGVNKRSPDTSQVQNQVGETVTSMNVEFNTVDVGFIKQRT